MDELNGDILDVSDAGASVDAPAGCYTSTVKPSLKVPGGTDVDELNGDILDVSDAGATVDVPASCRISTVKPSLKVPGASCVAEPDADIPDGNDDDVSVEADEKENQKAKKSTKYKRQSRPCPFCGEYQCYLNRHITRKHGDEEAVIGILKLPKQKMLQEFQALRKEGIYKANRSLIANGNTADLLRERRQGESVKLVMCGQCKGFFSSLHLWRHRKHCSESSAVTAAPADIPA